MKNQLLRPRSKTQWLIYYWLIFIGVTLIAIMNLAGAGWLLFNYPQIIPILGCLLIALIQIVIGVTVLGKIRDLARSQSGE
jgi:hypothetical protein